MLGKRENLRKVIKRDEKTMGSLNVTHAEMGNALKTLLLLTKQLHTRFVDCRSFRSLKPGQCLTPFWEPDPAEEEAVRRAIREQKFTNDVLQILDEKRGWSAHQVYEADFNFNEESVRVLAIYWGGSERCPFLSEEVYHGFQYGAADVFVVNRTSGASFQYSSLLPHMIKHHRFFEGAGATYRLDPNLVCKVLGPLDRRGTYAIRSPERVAIWMPKIIFENFLQEGKRVITTDEEWPQVLNQAIQMAQDKPYTAHFGSHTLFRKQRGCVLAIPQLVESERVDEEEFRDFMATASLQAGTLYLFKRQMVKARLWSEWLPGVRDGPKCYCSMLTHFNRFIFSL